MDIMKEFENASVEQIEAQIQEGVNIRDAMNEDLLALNRLRDLKVRTARRDAAAVAFQKEHGEHPEQVINPGPAVTEAHVKEPSFWDAFKAAFGK